MADLDEIFAQLKKEHGKGIGAFGGFYETADRIPTGFFPLDLAIGGGIPRARVTEIYGGEGASKTTLALSIIAQNQKMRPEEKAVYFDMEGTLDPVWAGLLGVDMSKVLVLRPDYAEELHEMMVGSENKPAVIDAKDVGVVVLDSLAAVVTTREGDGPADKSYMGNAAIAIKNMVNKLVVKMKRMRQGEGYDHPPPAMIWINQTRTKLNVMFGDPETTPGGNSPRFLYSLRLKLYGKSVTDKAVSEIMPIAKKVSATVKKHKVPITAVNAEYDLITQPHSGFRIGECDDWNLCEQWLKQEGLLVKVKGGWECDDQVYKTLVAIRDRYYSDYAFKLKVQGAIVKIATERSGYVMTAAQIAAADVEPDMEEAA